MLVHKNASGLHIADSSAKTRFFRFISSYTASMTKSTPLSSFIDVVNLGFGPDQGWPLCCILDASFSKMEVIILLAVSSCFLSDSTAITGIWAFAKEMTMPRPIVPKPVDKSEREEEESMVLENGKLFSEWKVSVETWHSKRQHSGLQVD